jgi:hypothetical protein
MEMNEIDSRLEDASEVFVEEVNEILNDESPLQGEGETRLESGTGQQQFEKAIKEAIKRYREELRKLSGYRRS